MTFYQGMPPPREWGPDEDEMLRELYARVPKIPYREMAKMLNRTVASISNRLHALGISGDRAHAIGPANPERTARAIELCKNGMTIKAIAAELKAERGTIRKWLRDAGLYVARTAPERARPQIPSTVLKCLKCHADFHSRHPAENRICDRCKDTSDWRMGSMWFGVTA